MKDLVMNIDNDGNGRDCDCNSSYNYDNIEMPLMIKEIKSVMIMTRKI